MGSVSEPGTGITDTPPAPAGLGRAILHRLGDLVAVDLRSLAVLRIGLAVTLPATLSRHAIHLWEASMAPAREGTVVQLAASGTPMADVVSGISLILVGFLASLVLLIGYRTRVATLVAWLVVLGIGAHSWAQVTGVDILLRLLLLWSVFLPLGARYSFDSAAREGTRGDDRLVCVGGIAFVLQLVLTTLLGGSMLSPDTVVMDGGEGLVATTLPAIVARSVEWVPANLVAGIDALALGAVVALAVPVLIAPLRLAAAVLMAAIHAFVVGAIEPTLLVALAGLAWVAVVPTRVWDAVFAWLGSWHRTRITIWYGSECPLRLRLLRTFFLLPDTPIRSTRENIELDVFRRQRKSWIVTNAHGYRYLRFRALAEVCRASPILFPLAPIMRAVVVEELGDVLFDVGERHQAFLHNLVHRLRPYPVQVRLPAWQQVVAAGALLVLLVWQLWVAVERNPAGQTLPMLNLIHEVLGNF